MNTAFPRAGRWLASCLALVASGVPASPVPQPVGAVREAAAGTPQRIPPDPWVDALARTTWLALQRQLPGTRIDCRPVRTAPPWTIDGGQPLVRLRVRDRQTGDAGVVYLFSPWQRLSMREGNTAPRVITVHRRAIVLGPFVTGRRSIATDRLAERSRSIVARISGVPFCEQGSQLGGRRAAATHEPQRPRFRIRARLQLRPYYLRLDYPAMVEGSFEALAPQRMVLVHRRTKYDWHRYDFFPPAAIDRTVPRPFDPTEQRLAPDVDLAAAGRRLDHAVGEVFAAATRAATDAARAAPEPDPRRLAQGYRAALRAAVSAYPGHRGPAHAAGVAAFEYWFRELVVALDGGGFPTHRPGHWPATTVGFDPGVVDDLCQLPPATVAALADLRAAFATWQARARAHPGSSPAEVGYYMPSQSELVLAEVGFRLRTAVRAANQGADRPVPSHRFQAFRFLVPHPDERSRAQPRACLPIEIRF